MARSIKKGSVVVAVGTKKGGFLFHSPDRKKWSVAGPFMEGGAVYHMILDPRDGRTVYASAPMGSEPWGPAIYRGRAEEEPKATQAFPKFKEGSDLSVSRIWHIEPGPSEAPDTIYAGAEPAALFRSDDRGDTWHDLGSLNYHTTRKEWQPGGGGLCLHSVLVDPRNARHLIVGISAVGAFETRDGGRSWTMENRGVRAEFLPNKYPEWGQCVHKLAWDASGDGSLFQQNHCGTYHRGPDGGEWTEVTKACRPISDFQSPCIQGRSTPRSWRRWSALGTACSRRGRWPSGRRRTGAKRGDVPRRVCPARALTLGFSGKEWPSMRRIRSVSTPGRTRGSSLRAATKANRGR